MKNDEEESEHWEDDLAKMEAEMDGKDGKTKKEI